MVTAEFSGCKNADTNSMIIVSKTEKPETAEILETRSEEMFQRSAENNKDSETQEEISAQTVSDVIEERISYRVSGVYSEGEYYDIDISGAKLKEGTDTRGYTEISGELYGDFRLDLIQNEKILDSMELPILRDDKFLILESVTEDLSYGCEIISNKKEYGSEIYPDLLQLDFFIRGEGETPQYARYFTVSGGRLTELPIYENGTEVSPYGTHLEQESEGVMVQHLVVSKSDGSYTVIKYQYTFDKENMRLNRQQVRFYG